MNFCAIYIVFMFSLSQGKAQFIAINFPTDPKPTTSVRTTCQSESGIRGICKPLHECSEVLGKIRKNQVFFQQVRCHDHSSRALVCCPSKEKESDRFLDISPPERIYEDCGMLFFQSGDLRDKYQGNKTAEEFKAKGFTVTILDMLFDSIQTFEYTNGTHNGTHEPRLKAFAVGGINARQQLSNYMALLGNSERWFCDGALINNQWVLTAAHCFDNQIPTIVRLGEYDHSDPTEKKFEVPLDFSLASFVIHPEYKSPSSYHDLALVKLNKRTPQLRHDLTPVCLPWGDESNTNLEGKEVTLTGWGATSFFGPSSPILQEVNVTVFNPSKCDRSYSALRGYHESFPKGIRKETSLCAGDEQGGKDACQGDSGGPIVYVDKKGRYTLAGIVSTGNGCGLKEFPGIYIPMHNPKYLSWIKQVAFHSSKEVFTVRPNTFTFQPL